MHRLHISPVWLISITIRLGYASLGDHPGASIGSSVAIATRTTSSPVEATISGVSPVSTLIEARYHAPARTWTTSQFTSGPSYQGRLSTRSSSIPTSSSDSSVYNMSTAIATPTSTTDDMTAISWPPGSWQSMVNIRPAAYNASSPDYRHQFVCPGTIKDTPPGGFPEPFHQTEKIQIWRIENFAFDLDPIGRIHSFAFRWSECATCRRYIQCDFHQPFSRGVFNRCQWPEFDFAFLNYPTSTLLIQSLPTFHDNHVRRGLATVPLTCSSSKCRSLCTIYIEMPIVKHRWHRIPIDKGANNRKISIDATQATADSKHRWLWDGFHEWWLADPVEPPE